MINISHKKTIAFLPAILIALSCVPVLAQTVVATGSCGKSATYTIYSDGTMRITGDGTISNDSDNPYRGSYGDMIKHIYVDGTIGVASIDSFDRYQNAVMDYVFASDAADFSPGKPISLFTEGFFAKISDYDMVLKPEEMSEQLFITSDFQNLEITWHSVDK